MITEMKPYLKRAWAEVSLPKLRKNVEIIRSLNSANTEIMAVVKADAYGHGDEHIVNSAVAADVKTLVKIAQNEFPQVRIAGI